MSKVTVTGQYVRGYGVLEKIGEVSAKLGSKVYVLGGKTALSLTQSVIESKIQEAGGKILKVEWFGGESSRANAELMAEKAKSCGADVMIAVGGGKAMDTGKLAAEICGLPLVTVPTIAATCASVAPVSVVYNEKGEFVDVANFDRAPDAVVVDTKIIMEAPLQHMAAGLGDTLAKWYEYRVSIVKAVKNSFTLGALSNGKLCYDLILQFGTRATESVRSKKYDEALDEAVDAIILFAGTASALGGDAIRGAAAHAFYNGLTVIPAAHAAGHGLTVGYGNLVLLALEERSDEEMAEAIALAKSCGVPVKLAELGDISLNDVKIAAKTIVANPDMGNMPFEVTEEKLLTAVERVEKF